jgi:hypothetical protein
MFNSMVAGFRYRQNKLRGQDSDLRPRGHVRDSSSTLISSTSRRSGTYSRPTRSGRRIEFVEGVRNLMPIAAKPHDEVDPVCAPRCVLHPLR